MRKNDESIAQINSTTSQFGRGKQTVIWLNIEQSYFTVYGSKNLLWYFLIHATSQ
jgi:hypothetical protein